MGSDQSKPWSGDHQPVKLSGALVTKSTLHCGMRENGTDNIELEISYSPPQRQGEGGKITIVPQKGYQISKGIVAEDAQFSVSKRWDYLRDELGRDNFHVIKSGGSLFTGTVVPESGGILTANPLASYEIRLSPEADAQRAINKVASIVRDASEKNLQGYNSVKRSEISY